jgi:hypothetical protein
MHSTLQWEMSSAAARLPSGGSTSVRSFREQVGWDYTAVDASVVSGDTLL